MTNLEMYEYGLEKGSFQVGTLIGETYEVLDITPITTVDHATIRRHPELVSFEVVDSQNRKTIMSSTLLGLIKTKLYFPADYWSYSVGTVYAEKEVDEDGNKLLISRNGHYYTKDMNGFRLLNQAQYKQKLQNLHPFLCKENVETIIRITGSNKKTDLIYYDTNK